MNQTIQTIKTRRAIREYKNKQVSKEIIKEIIECGKLAPSAMNRQLWKFIVITDRTLIKELSDSLVEAAIKEYPHVAERMETNEDPIFYNAPVLIMILKPRNYKWGDFDCACAAQNMMLAAKSLGLGSCPIGMSRLLKVEKLRILGMPDDYDLSITLTFGYPNEKPKVKERKEDNVTWK